MGTHEPMEPEQKPAGQPLCLPKIAMSLALTGRTFLDLWDWWDCLSKSELIKLSWFSAQPSMNLHSSRYPYQTVFGIQIIKFLKKILKIA
jgi:hypothetical protein